MRIRWLAVSCAWLAIVFAGVQHARSQATDPHELYEKRCGRCHTAHAGEFVRQSLQRGDGRIVGRETGKGIRSFLQQGHGKLAAHEIDVMVAHLTSILEAGALFRRKCLICHDRAIVLARRELIQRDGKLVGRYSGRDIATFMENHGRLEEAETGTVLRMFDRQLATKTSE